MNPFIKEKREIKDPTIEEQRSYYDKWNFEYRNADFERIDPEFRLRSLRILSILEKLNLTEPRILEVGCGTGWFTEKLCSFGKVSAIDLSPTAIAIARGRCIDAEFIAADFSAYECEPALFDIVICMDTLFYVLDQSHFVDKLTACLKDDGYLIVMTINKFVYLRSREIKPPVSGQVRKWLSRRQLKNMLSKFCNILLMTTVEPRGDGGVLRIVNSRIINKLMNRVFSENTIKKFKERMGFGGAVVVLAIKRKK